MVETSTKIRNKQTNVEKDTHVSQLTCSHLNLVLPLAVMQNINIMCMHAHVCVWQHRYLCMYKANTKYVSDIPDVWSQNALSIFFSCYFWGTIHCYALTDSWIPFIVVSLRNLLHKSTAGSWTASLKMFPIHIHTFTADYIMLNKILKEWDKKQLAVY